MDKALVPSKVIKDDLKLLIGTWKGEGIGSFPTIESFRFREELKFEFIELDQVIYYIQRTWIKGEVSTPSHWEFGFIRITEDGKVQISNCQNGGRVEVLLGNVIENDREKKRMELNFQSTFIGNDSRIAATSRNFIIENDVLGYTIDMSTNSVQSVNQHIEAALIRI